MILPPLPDKLLPLKAFIEANAQPCIALSMRPHGNGSLTDSKVGGTAALPEDFKWPHYDYRPLDFMLQINLAEITCGVDFGLPADGFLSFFYDVDHYDIYESPSDFEVERAFRVHYIPAGVPLVNTSPPGGKGQLSEARISFTKGLSLPSFGSTALGDFSERVREAVGGDISDERIDDFADAYGSYSATAANPGDPNLEGGPHRMFGHAEYIQEEMHALTSEWVLLFQLASDDAINSMWGDAGMLYFWITKADLAARRFDKVTIDTQCS